MPGTDIPLISPADLVEARPRAVLLFLSDLLAEVRDRMPQVERASGRWIDVTALPSEVVGDDQLLDGIQQLLDGIQPRVEPPRQMGSRGDRSS